MSSRRRALNDTEAATLPSRLALVLSAGVARTAPTAGGAFSVLDDDMKQKIARDVIDAGRATGVSRASISAWFYSDLRPEPFTTPFCLTVRFPLTGFGAALLNELAPRVPGSSPSNHFTRDRKTFIALVEAELKTLLPDVSPDEVVGLTSRVFWHHAPPQFFVPDGYEEFQYFIKANHPHVAAIVDHFVDRNDPNEPKARVENIRKFYRTLMKRIFESSSPEWQRVVKFPDAAPEVRERPAWWKVYQAEADVEVVQESPTRAPDHETKALLQQLQQQQQQQQQQQ